MTGRMLIAVGVQLLILAVLLWIGSVIYAKMIYKRFEKI